MVERAPLQEIILDWSLLNDILRQRARVWAFLVLVIWPALTLLCLLLVPRSFTATASVALQQSNMPGGSLAALSGLTSSSAKTYAGVIHSRRFAQAAVRANHIQALCGLPTEEAAVEMVQKGVTLDDKSDGLLYLKVTLPGPPKLARGQSEHMRQVQAAVPAVAETYVNLLSRYLATTNTNRDAALLREAQKQVRKARANYDRSVRDFARIARASPVSASLSARPPALPSAEGTASADGTGSQGDAMETASQLPSLYGVKSRLEAEIAAGNALNQGTAALASGSPQSLATLPGEDPLLQDARLQVIQAATQLKNLRIELSDDNPSVVAARARLQIAQARLASESRSLRQGRTSSAIRQKSLLAQYETVLRQIAVAERQSVSGRATSIEIERSRNEMLLALEVLKATATQYATLSVQKEAGRNLMDIIDTPQVPLSGSPGAAMLAMLCFFLTLLLVLIALVVEYLRRSGRRRLALTG